MLYEYVVGIVHIYHFALKIVECNLAIYRGVKLYLQLFLNKVNSVKILTNLII